MEEECGIRELISINPTSTTPQEEQNQQLLEKTIPEQKPEEPFANPFAPYMTSADTEKKLEKKLRTVKIRSVTIALEGEKIWSPYTRRRKLTVTISKPRENAVRLLLEALATVAEVEARREPWLSVDVVDNKQRMLRIVMLERPYAAEKYLYIYLSAPSNNHDYEISVIVSAGGSVTAEYLEDGETRDIEESVVPYEIIEALRVALTALTNQPKLIYVGEIIVRESMQEAATSQ